MVMICGLGENLKFWAAHKTSIAEDILERIQRQISAEIPTFYNSVYNETLFELDTRVLAMGGQGIAKFGLPQP